MPITNRPDPNYEPPEQETFADGSYKVNGVSWVTTDDSEAPIFKVRKNSASLYAVYRGIMSDGSNGPPGSVSPGEVAMLVKAFGGDPDKLPDREQDPTKFLIVARDEINKQEKELTVKVSGGWIQHVPGMNLPVDKFFTFEIGRFATRNEVGDPAWQEGTYGKWFGVEFVVVGDLHGRPTMFDGATHFQIISYPIKADDDGNVTYETNSSGQWTASTVAFDHFLGAFAPAAFEEDFEDPTNILPEVESTYNKDRRRAITQVTKSNKGNLRLNVSGFTSVDEELPPMPAETPSRNVEDEIEESAAIVDVYELIDKLAGGKAFASEGTLSTKGKKWCKNNLKEFLNKEGYPASFGKWDETVIAKVLGFLKTLDSSDEEDEF